MKVEAHRPPDKFRPIRLIIDIEDKEEYEALLEVIDHRVNRMRDFSTTETLTGTQVRNMTEILAVLKSYRSSP